MLSPVINMWTGLLLFHEPVSPCMLSGCIIVIACRTYAAIPQPISEKGAGV